MIYHRFLFLVGSGADNTLPAVSKASPFNMTILSPFASPVNQTTVYDRFMSASVPSEASPGSKTPYWLFRDRLHREAVRDSLKTDRAALLAPSYTPKEHKHRVHAQIELQGGVLRLKSRFAAHEKGRLFAAKVGSRGNKSAITEFSRASRNNMVDKLLSIKPDLWLNAKFLTLTYHFDYPNPERAKQNLVALEKRITRYCRKHGEKYRPVMFWVMEFQERGAPHFHCFLLRCPYIPQSTLLRWWQEITGDSSITQVDIQRLDTRRKAMSYVSKYVSKSAGRAGNTLLDIGLYLAALGRFWGIRGDTKELYADLIKWNLPASDEGLRLFIAYCELRWPFLLGRWSFGFRVMAFEGLDGLLETLDQSILQVSQIVRGE